MDDGADVLKVVVADRRAIVADGLAAMINGHPALRVVAVVSGAEELRSALGELRPDVVVVGIAEPDDALLDACTWLPAEVHLVGVSPDADAVAVSRLLSAGVRSIVVTNAATDDLLAAVLGGPGETPRVSAGQLSSVVRSVRSDEVARQQQRTLTPREIAVLRQLARGRGTAAIAGDLGIGANTVRAHVRHILQKLGAHSRLEAVANAVREGTLDRDDGE